MNRAKLKLIDGGHDARGFDAADRYHVLGSTRDAALAYFKESGLDETDFKLMQATPRSVGWCDDHVGFDCDGCEYPYFDLHGQVLPGVYRVRLHRDDGPKYLNPKRMAPHAYLSPHITNWPEIFADPTREAYVTEGERKAALLCKLDIPCVGIGGVDSHGSKKRDLVLLKELVDLAAGGRKITAIYDNDLHANPKVRAARARLLVKLKEAGAAAGFCDIPENGPKGIDDVYVAGGRKAVKAILASRVPFDDRQALTEMRHRKGNADARKAAAAKLVLEALKLSGSFLQDGGALLYFHEPEKVLLPLDDPKCRELRAFIAEHFGIDGASSEWNAVHEALCNHAARHGTPTQTSLFSQYVRATNRLYITASPSSMFRITARGHDIVDNGTDGVLMRSRGTVARISPDKARPSRRAFDDVVNVPNFVAGHSIGTDELRLLHSVAILAIPFPELLPTRPLPLFHGPFGSAKTCAGKAAGISLFGSRFQVSGLDGNKLDGFDAAVVGNAFAVMDNIDGKVPGLENRLALAATGGEIVRRKLYSTMEEYRARIVSFVWLTSRDPASFTRPDVVDRLLYFPCERRKEFQAESEIITAIEANRPAFWAYLLEVLPKILRALQTYKPRHVRIRMADFANFAMAVAPVLGVSRTRMERALVLMEQEKMQFASEQSILPTAFTALREKIDTDMSAGRSTDATLSLDRPISATALMNTLAKAWPLGAAHFPFKRATTFGVALQEQLVELRTTGIKVTATPDKRAKSWVYTLELVPADAENTP